MITTNEELKGLIILAKQAGFADHHLVYGTEACIIPQLAKFTALLVEQIAVTAEEQGLELRSSN